MSENLFNTLDRELSIKSLKDDVNKIKYIDTNQLDFNNFYSSGNRMYQNFDLDTQNDLTYGYNSRRNSSKHNTGMMPIEQPTSKQSLYCKNGICKIPKNIKSTPIRSSSNDSVSSDESNRSESNRSVSNRSVSNRSISNNQKTKNKQDLNQIEIIKTDSDLKLGNEHSQIKFNNYMKSAAKIPSSVKESEIYWDNTRRRNLDTSIYTDNPTKVGGRGFGDIPKYDLLLNGIGISTRQDNPNIKPQNVDNDRIFTTNHNYNNPKFHVSEQLDCGVDTRYLNKKMIN